jgi:antibiotic biosynthesis monooxygenase (ABM) superfamily enzyme
MSNGTTQHTPPRYKLAIITWAGAFGVITLILDLLGPTMAGWPLVLRTLLISVLMVNALTWIVLPGLTRLFRPWLLAPRPHRRRRQTPAMVVDGDELRGRDSEHARFARASAA